MSFFTRNFLFFLCFFPFFTSGKPVYSHPADTLPTQISWQQQDSLVRFQAQLRTLRQIAGAPEAFYTYFWEFGDGDFSFNEQPQHIFSDSGEYTIRLFATNNYDDGKAPPTRPRQIRVNSGNALASNYNHTGFFKQNRQLQLKVNRMPRPGEDMVCIIGYQNPKGQEKPLSGSLVLFYNDKKFKKKNFGLTDLRNYNGEKTSDVATLLARCKKGKVVPLYASNEIATHGPNHVMSTTVISNTTAAGLLLRKQKIFDNQNTLRFTKMLPGEKRYVFAVLHTTPEMIKDTNATVTLNALMIPDDPEEPVLESNLELQIVASHDPNRMMLSNRRLNYRLMGKHKKLKYKVRFQNTGKGPAHTINVGVHVAPALDPESLSINEMYPKCIPCATAEPGQSCLDTLISRDSIHFIFKNIYLSGIRQKGVEDKDSTKGFVEYHLRFKEKPKKMPFWSQAGIVFDKNEPVYTNKMHTRYIHGISPAVIAGYQKGLNDEQDKNSPFVVGAALAPYSPYKFYFQVEAYLGIYKKISSTQITPLTQPRDTSYGAGKYMVYGRGQSIERNLMTLNIVPLEIRKNLNNWFSAGAGLSLKGNLYEKNTVTTITRLQDIQNGSTLDLSGKPVMQTRHFSNITPAAFLDINVGKVRVGPALGVRLLHSFSPDKTGVMMYAIWRL